MISLFQDLRYGARMLRKNPGFTLAATITLMLGIGGNTAIFTNLGTVLNALNFGFPLAVQPMRTFKATMRYKF